MSVQIKGSGTIGGIDEGLVISGIITTTSFVEHAGDSNTKFGFEGPDTITFETAGSERLRITSGGFVGIGTNSPAKALEVTSNTVPQFQVGMSNNSARASLMHNGSHLYFDTTSGDQVFRTGGTTERFRITSAGKIGIGTDDPKQWVSINNGRVSIDIRGDHYGAWIDGDTQGTSAFNVGRWHNAGGRMRSGGSNDNDLVVETQNTAHTLQLQPSGGIVQIGGNLEIANGNLVISNAGSGIDFSATSDGSGTSNRSEVLDDYEEGSFTPIMSVEGQGSNASLAIATGLYTKVGSMVSVWIEVQFNGTPSGRSTSNAWQFSNLPFTSQSYTVPPSGLRDYRFPMIGHGYDTSSTYGSNGHFVFRLFDGNSAGRIEWQHSDLTLKNASLFIQNGTIIQIHACYPDF